MKILACLPIALALAGAPIAASAQVTQTYTYDGNGRLTAAGMSSSSGTHSSAYTYDDADNRTGRAMSGTGVYAAISRLDAADKLLPNQALVSNDGRFSLAVRPSGALELRLGETTLWSDLTAPEGKAAFEVGVDGAVFDPTASASQNLTGAYFALQNDGNLVLRDSAEAVLWQSHTCCH